MICVEHQTKAPITVSFLPVMHRRDSIDISDNLIYLSRSSAYYLAHASCGQLRGPFNLNNSKIEIQLNNV
jgi:hypothetical protein